MTPVVFTPEEERVVVRKIGRVLMPLVGLSLVTIPPARDWLNNQWQMIISYTNYPVHGQERHGPIRHL